MRLIAAVFAVLVIGCQSNNPSDLPVNPGPGGPGGGGGFGGGDGGIDSDGGAPGYQVCLLTTDARGLNGCAQSGVAGFMVTLGSGSDAQTATTDDQGFFTMTIPSGNGLYWTVSGTTIYTTTQALPGASIIPVITTNFYQNVLETDNNVGDVPGDGGVFIKVVNSNGMPIMGATATVDPNTPYGALYDGTSMDLWNTGSSASTGADGTIWFPTVLPGTATITVMPAADSSPSQYIVPVAASTLTMVFASVST